MRCPYCQKKLHHVETIKNDLIDEETGVINGSAAVVNEEYEYADCIMQECAVWHDGRCHYND